MALSQAHLQRLAEAQANADAAEVVLLRVLVRDFITSQTEMLRVLNVMRDLAEQEALRGNSIWKHAQSLCQNAIAAGKRSQLVDDNPNVEGGKSERKT